MSSTNLEIIISAVDHASNAFKAVESRLGGLKQVGSTLQSVGMQMSMMGGAMALPFLGAIKAATDFDGAMRNVQAVSGATQSQFEQLSNAAKDFGAKTKFSAQQAAEAMYAFGSAGFKTNQIIAATKGTLSLAAAAQASLGQAAEATTQTITQFGLSVSDSGRIADIFSDAIANSALNMQRLQDGMSYIGPLAGQLGIKLTETTAALMELNQAGQIGAKAGMELRMALSQLLNPTKATITALQQMGVSVQAVNPATHSLSEIIRVLAGHGMSTAQAMTIFGTRAGPGMAVLVNQGADALQRLTTQLNNSGGAADKMAKTQMSGLAGTMAKLKSALETTAISIGQLLTPAVTKLANVIQGALKWFNDLPAPLKDAIVNFTALSAVILTVGGGTAMLIGTLIKMFVTFKSAVAGVQAFTAAMKLANITMLANPVGLIIAAIAAAIVIIALIATHWKEFVDFFQHSNNAIAVVFRTIWNGFAAIVKTTIEMITAYWTAFASFWGTLWFGISAVSGAVWSGIKSVVDTLVSGLRKSWSGFAGFWQGLWNGIVKVFNTVYNIIAGGINAMISGINGLLGLLNKVTGQSWQIPELKLKGVGGNTNININVSPKNTKDQIIDAVGNALGDSL